MIHAMLRVKNEGRWIGRVLDSIKPVAATITMMDDHSADDTVEISQGRGAAILPSPFAGLDEARDKDWLLAHVPAAAGDWVMCIDGDEVLRESSVPALLALTERQEPAFSFKVLYLWDREDQARVDGVYGRFYRPSFFRWQPGLTFRRTEAGGNFHCSSVPACYCGRCPSAAVDLLHLGYLHREDRVRKWEWYCKKDPHNSVEDGYRHIVIGDVFPADSQFAHAGPLRLEALNV